VKFGSLKFRMDHEDKDFNTYVVKSKKYDTGNPEKFLRCRLTLNEQMKNNGYSACTIPGR
jgi:UTP-glucose-1-phosphate uridylyltransferase